MKNIIRFFSSIIISFIILIPGISISQDFTAYKINDYNINAKYIEDSDKVFVDAVLNVIPQNDLNNLLFFIRHKISLKSVKAYRGELEIPIEYLYKHNDSILIKSQSNFSSTNNYLFEFLYEIPINDKIEKPEVLFFWYPYTDGNISTWKLKFDAGKDFSVYSPIDNPDNESEQEKYGFRFSDNILLPRLPIIIARTDSINNKTFYNNGIKFSYNFYSKDTTTINKIIDETSGALNYFNDLIGKYNYKKLCLVETQTEGVNSQPSFIIAGYLFIDYFDKGFGFDRWCAHEIAHQWFGSGAFAKYGTKGNSCVFEPLAEYMNIMYMDFRKGNNTLVSELRKIKTEYDSTILNTEKDIPIISAGAMRVVYLKGPIIFHCIRKILGEENWLNYLMGLYNDYKNKFFTYEDLKNYLDKFDSTGKCREFYEKWMTEKGLPEEVYF